MYVLQVVLAAGWKEVWKVVKARRRPVRRRERRGNSITRNEGKAVFSIPGFNLGDSFWRLGAEVSDR